VPASPLNPLSSRTHWSATKDNHGWIGELKKEGASPPLELSPAFERNKLRTWMINLFERAIQGLRINEKTDTHIT
jgi:hypothetical protein